MRRRFVIPAIGLLLCAALPGAAPRPAAAQITVPCQAVSPTDPSAGVLVGNARGGHYYASVPQTVSIDTDIKVVVRMTGTGPLHISAIGPDLMTVAPLWIEPHIYGSSWNGILPGDEWGTSWRLPMPGCWDLHADRAGISGDIYFNAAVPVLKSFSLRLQSGHRSGDTFRSRARLAFVVRPQIDPSTSLPAYGTVTVRDGSKTVRTLTLMPSRKGLPGYHAVTRLRVTAPTTFTATARLSFQGTTMTRDVRFQVLPLGR